MSTYIRSGEKIKFTWSGTIYRRAEREASNTLNIWNNTILKHIITRLFCPSSQREQSAVSIAFDITNFLSFRFVTCCSQVQIMKKVMVFCSSCVNRSMFERSSPSRFGTSGRTLVMKIPFIGYSNAPKSPWYAILVNSRHFPRYNYLKYYWMEIGFTVPLVKMIKRT